MNKRFRKWYSFVVGLVTIYLIVFKIVPFINQYAQNEVVRFVNDNELDTGTLFYTESEIGIYATRDLVHKRRSQ